MKSEQACKEFLLMTIECSKEYEGIQLDGSVIKTGQHYYGMPDADMSDLAVRFYEIIYGNILKKAGIETLLTNQNLSCKALAGDTMNSFNTVKKKAPDTPKLELYKQQYHCLANFWLLPMQMGRTIKGSLNKGGKRAGDYMDRFLPMIAPYLQGKESTDTCDDDVKSYLGLFKNWNDFCDKHFIQDVYVSKDKIEAYSRSGGEHFIDVAFVKMEQRAEKIAQSEYADELNALFECVKKGGVIL